MVITDCFFDESIVWEYCVFLKFKRCLLQSYVKPRYLNHTSRLDSSSQHSHIHPSIHLMILTCTQMHNTGMLANTEHHYVIGISPSRFVPQHIQYEIKNTTKDNKC